MNIDPTSLGFLIAMVVVGGAIAGFGDYIGRRIGKKRRSFFFLRPKHTAIFFTVLAGMFGTFLAMTLLFALSEPVRQWIIQGTALQGRLTELQESLATEQGRLDAATRAAEEARRDLNEETRKLDAAEEQVADMQRDARQLTVQASQLRRQSESLRRDVQSFRTRLQTAAASLKQQQDRINQLTNDADALAANVGSLTTTNQRLQVENLRLTNTRRELEGSLVTLREDVSRLEEEAERARQEKAIAEEERDRVEADLEAARISLTAARNQLNLLRAQHDALQSELNTTIAIARFNDLIFAGGEEMDRASVAAPASVPAARQIILAAIGRAADLAKARGAAPRPGELEPAGLISLTDPQTGAIVPPETQVAAAANAMVTMNSDVLLIVRAAYNAFARERTAVRLELYPNTQVYDAGEVLGEIRVEANTPREQVLQRVQDYLQNTIRPKAIDDGLVIGPQGVGEISIGSMIDALNLVGGASRSARLQFVAANDTRRGDDLLLNLRVR